MKDIKKNLKNYICINVTFLCLYVYVIFFPVIANLLNLLSPMLTKCSYQTLSGGNCPLCGGTRYIANLKMALTDITYLFQPFGIIILFILFELIFRVCVLSIIKIKHGINKKIVIFDIIINIMAISAYIWYVIYFFLK